MDDIDLHLNPSDTAADLRRRYRFIDVREDWELEKLPIPDALHMPMSAFDPGVLEADKDRPLLVICAKGVRSRRAAEYLRGQGWRNTFSLAGGRDSLPGL